MAISIPYSRFKAFQHNQNDGRRYGQHFYDYMELHKATSAFDKLWCDKLYNANNKLARQMILNAIDFEN